MLAALAAALSLASSLTIEVPYLPQTDALCGGAAAAMVFRYWGDAHADPQQFAPLIERRGNAVGIADDVLVRAIGARGWRTEQLPRSAPAAGALDPLQSHLAARQPVIVLLADRGDQYHYVVVVGVTEEEVLVHDPSWGPSRAIKRQRFTDLWNASHNWALIVLPGARPATTTAHAESGTTAPAESATQDPCDAAVARAVEDVNGRGIAAADAVLEPLRSGCSGSPALLRELAGVRFAQKRWHESESLARAALVRGSRDSYATAVLGASLFMQDDPVGALRAWNAIDQPRLDLVRISGLTRSRYQAIVEAIGLRSGALLTADAFVQARHRLEDLPDRASSRLSLRPGEDGFASVDVAIAERAGAPHGYADWTALALRAAVEREAGLVLPGFTGQGEVWSASWRWWSNRPRVAVAFSAPRAAGLPGVWRVEGSWDAETYALGSTGPVRESRTRGALTVSDWILPRLRYSVTGGLDSWNTGRRAISFGGRLERRFVDDRISLAADATTWLPLGGNELNRRFDEVGVRLRAQTSSSPRTWAYDVGAGATRVSDAAPLAIWAGAGEGRARTALLRAHPLLEDGIIDASASFGRTLRYANVEGQRWLSRPLLLRIGAAAFLDVAQASRRASAADGLTQADVGGGLRLRVPGAPGILRVDVAHGLRDGADAVTVGWVVQ